ncbi:class I lanthipeptide [Niastella vici]|uniref:class I lanthipeptide n=1 Tax=Niastella vici TaxID=1703345 RepID=UPI001301E9B4|nr:class I lanthipeptide [Niastella vici]
MKKKIEVKLELNKKTIAKLDPNSMKKKGNGAGDGASQTDAKSNGADCSCACCASTES